jgi:hypothetical protein
MGEAHSPDQEGAHFEKLSVFLQNRIQEIVAFEYRQQKWQEVPLKTAGCPRNRNLTYRGKNRLK